MTQLPALSSVQAGAPPEGMHHQQSSLQSTQCFTVHSNFWASNAIDMALTNVNKILLEIVSW